MSDDTKKLLHQFFPTADYSDEEISEAVGKKEIVTEPDQILPFLLTTLLDEKIVEVELDGESRVYFSRLKDDLPDLLESEVDNQKVLLEPDYEPGDYLKELQHLISLPLEPGIGNLRLRNSQRIVFRIFTKAFGVEFATTFLKTDKVRDVPVLRLAYPKLARIVHGAREFRAKVIDGLDFLTEVDLGEDKELLELEVADISVKGIALSVTKKEFVAFNLEQNHSLKLYVEDELVARLDGTVKHLSKVRKRARIEYLCGFELALPTRTSVAVVESLVARVQRAHLQELAEKSRASGIDLIA